MNITLSVILKPVFLSVKKTFLLSKVTALALYDVLAETLDSSQFDIKIKWPNDILVNSKKMAGILIENSFKESNVSNCIIGIGLNVNQKNFGSLSTATSLSLLLEKNCNNDQIMDRLFVHLEKWYLQLRQENYDRIDKTYLGRLFRLDALSEFEDHTGVFTATLKNVNEDGHLLLETSSGETKSFDMKAVKFIY